MPNLPRDEQQGGGRNEADPGRISGQRALDAAFASAITAFDLATASLLTEQGLMPRADAALAECDGFQG